MSQKSPIAALSGPMEYTRIGYEQQNQVATITLDRPKAMNAIDEPMRFELFHAFNAAMADDQVRAIVIRANGDGFSAGTDLQEAFERQDNYGLLEDQYRPLINQVLECPKPVIAAVQGACAGVGASIALACDLMVMGESAFIYLAFANVGLIPDGGMCWHLARNLGYKRAYQIIAEADRIPASRCLDFGLANKVVSDDALASEAQDWAERLATRAPLTLKYAKQALQQAQRKDLADTMQVEAGLQALCSVSEDHQEGVKAFFEKRKPEFQGR